MRPLLLTFTFVFLIANLATGQTMQTVIDNLIKHKLIDESHKDDITLILKRKEDTSNSTVLQALLYVEMIKLAGRENLNSVGSHLKIADKDPDRHQQDSINGDLKKFLAQIDSAGLTTPSLYAEFKNNIEKDTYLARIQLIGELTQKSGYSQYLTSEIFTNQKKKNSLSSKQIQDAISEWETIGILKHLTKEQISVAKKKALSGSNENLNDALLNFPDVIHWFDTELENLNDPYAELLKEFSKISHGAFKPTNISDNFCKPIRNKVTVKFTLNNKNYAKDFNVQDDWIDADFFDFVKQAVTENKLAGQFYELYEGGQGGNIIFLIPKQHQYLKENKLAVFAEDYKIEEE